MVAGLLLLACGVGGDASPGANGESRSPAPTSGASAPPATMPASTATPAPSATVASGSPPATVPPPLPALTPSPTPEPTPQPTPEPTPEPAPSPTATASSATPTPQPPPPAGTPVVAEPGVATTGPAAFIAHTAGALALIEERAPQSYVLVLAGIETITLVEQGSGMDVFTRTYLVGEVTAYAPGFIEAVQRLWYAGTIVHDACHSERYTDGLPYTGREAELACLAQQRDALRLLDGQSDPGEYRRGSFETYVQSLIDGADDVANQYWNDPQRHW